MNGDKETKVYVCQECDHVSVYDGPHSMIVGGQTSDIECTGSVKVVLRNQLDLWLAEDDWGDKEIGE